MFWGKTTKDIGACGEKIAAKYLQQHGYRIIAQNVRSAHGEIDIIAENKEFLIFAEVKARRDDPKRFADYGLPCEAVNKAKQQHILYTARVYLEKHPSDKEVRFDVLEVYLGQHARVNHIEDAFHL
ncbi:MAG: YraN family protein [Clostridia bacterium]|nr:YraN family protein [Clostridia bacterium]